MKSAILTRTETGDQGTFGQFMTDSGYKCVMGELPWHDDLPDISCEKEGTYTVTKRYSPKHGCDVYHVDGDKTRSNIEIHSANFMGDASKGYKSQLLGCMAPGTEFGNLDGQKAVLNSKYALLRLETDLNNEPFVLTIKWADSIGPGSIK